jgi:Ca2+-dependent lipid-binding protein
MNAFEYAKYVIGLCANYPLIKSIEITLLDEPVLKIKATVNDQIFMAHNIIWCK